MRKLPKKVTADWLREVGACPREIRSFRRKWPKGCAINLRNACTALHLGLNLGWLVEVVLHQYGFVTGADVCAYQTASVKSGADRNQALYLIPDGWSARRRKEATDRAYEAEDKADARAFLRVWRKAKKVVPGGPEW